MPSTSPPGIGGVLLTPPCDAPGCSFRIDHDQKFNTTTNLQYVFHKQTGTWAALSWRYDSGLVSSTIGDVNDLLTLTRFESGKVPSRQPVQLDQFVNQALDELSLRDKGAVVSKDLQPGVTVRADPEALKQVVTNLAQNALKYAPGAEQHWSVFQADGRAAIRLQDTGPGISRQDLPHIFERFYRGDKARDRSMGGSGLGLAIAKSIVEAHQGTIEAASEPGQGATFTAWLPLAA